MTKRALVLGGGGARGPYQIGVWRALRERGMEFHIVTGSSVGALNGALVVQDDYDLAVRMWENLTIRDVVSGLPDYDVAPDSQQLLAVIRRLVEQGGLDTTPLDAVVRRAVDEARVRASPMEYGLVASRFPDLKPVQLCKDDIPEGELVDYMLASSSWFPFFRRKTIDGVDYIDGAYADNLPADLALRCGAEEIIAVDLLGTGIVHSYKAEVPITYIRSHWHLGDMMAFDADHARRAIRLGYHDGMRAFHRLEGAAYAFTPGSSRDNAFALREPLSKIRARTGVSFFADYERLPRLHHSLRYHSGDNRFLDTRLDGCSPGRALTTAAEIAGELLYIPPDRTYTLREFNRLLRAGTADLLSGRTRANPDDIPPVMPARTRSRVVLSRVYRTLRDSFIQGTRGDTVLRLGLLSPLEFAAAYYLLAVEIREKNPEGESNQ